MAGARRPCRGGSATLGVRRRGGRHGPGRYAGDRRFGVYALATVNGRTLPYTEPNFGGHFVADTIRLRSDGTFTRVAVGGVPVQRGTSGGRYAFTAGGFTLTGFDVSRGSSFYALRPDGTVLHAPTVVALVYTRVGA